MVKYSMLKAGKKVVSILQKKPKRSQNHLPNYSDDEYAKGAGIQTTWTTLQRRQHSLIQVDDYSIVCHFVLGQVA